MFAECFFLKLGKEASLPRVFSSTQQINIFFLSFVPIKFFYYLHITLGDIPRVAVGISKTLGVLGVSRVLRRLKRR
jgi:hypothetical protein